MKSIRILFVCIILVTSTICSGQTRIVILPHNEKDPFVVDSVITYGHSLDSLKSNFGIWGFVAPFIPESVIARCNLDSAKLSWRGDTATWSSHDTTRFYPVIDTVRFDKIHICGRKHIYNSHVIDSGYYKWVPVLRTIWKPKIQVYLTPEEWKKLMELLHPPRNRGIWLETGTTDAYEHGGCPDTNVFLMKSHPDQSWVY